VGHAGIDFHWSFQAEIIAATNGEIVEIRTFNRDGSFLLSILVMSGGFVVPYDDLDAYSSNPDLDIGSKVISGQAIGYLGDSTVGDGSTMMHWSFGKWGLGTGQPNPEGTVEKFIVDYMCLVSYFSETERLRLFHLWNSAIYTEAGGFKS
jgi:hypothetical protein